MTRGRGSLRDFHPGEIIEIGGNRYTFVARNEERSHKILLEYGKQALVAKVQRQGGGYFALKCFNDGFQSSAIKQCATFVAGLSGICGMQAAKVEIIDPDSPKYAPAISQYPFLEYAIVMPWLPGHTWSALRYLHKIQEYPAPDYPACRKRAISLAELLCELHTRSVAHCDVCPRNVFINGEDEAALIDFESIFSSSLQPPPWGYPAGQNGYRHHSVPMRPNKQWGPCGDLFAGALLIAELITWHDSQVREQSNDETFVEQEQLHNSNSEPYRVLLTSLERISKDCAILFSQAWTSKVLENCPNMDDWVAAVTNTPEVLAISQKPTEHITRRVQKPRKDRSRAIQPPDTTQRLPAHLLATHMSEHVADRRSVRYKGDRCHTIPSAVSQHVVRRVPASEIKSRREKLPVDKKTTPSGGSTPLLPATQTPSSQVSWGEVTTALVVVVVVIVCCALLGYWLL